MVTPFSIIRLGHPTDRRSTLGSAAGSSLGVLRQDHTIDSRATLMHNATWRTPVHVPNLGSAQCDGITLQCRPPLHNATRRTPVQDMHNATRRIPVHVTSHHVAWEAWHISPPPCLGSLVIMIPRNTKLIQASAGMQHMPSCESFQQQFQLDQFIYRHPLGCSMQTIS